MPTALLIDGHSQAYRAYFAIKTALSTRAGEPTGAVFGFARRLIVTLRELKPDFVIASFDVGDTWRHTEFPAYKATREAMPDDMRLQMQRITQLLGVFGIPIVTYPNYEADDVIGSLAKQAAAQGVDVLIMSGDRDLFQLVDDHIRVLYTSGGPNPTTTAYGLAEVAERYGLTPQQFIDYKALVGDSSDNIPGVPGVGEKTAIKLLQQFGDVDTLYTRLDEVSGAKLRENLAAAHAIVLRNRHLVTITTTLDVSFADAIGQARPLDRDAAAVLFTELEFRSMLKDLPESAPAEAAVPSAVPTVEENGQMTLFAAAARRRRPSPNRRHPNTFASRTTPRWRN